MEESLLQSCLCVTSRHARGLARPYSLLASPVPLLAVGALEDRNAFQNQRVEVLTQAYVICCCHWLPTQVLKGKHADTATCIPSGSVSTIEALLEVNFKAKSSALQAIPCQVILRVPCRRSHLHTGQQGVAPDLQGEPHMLAGQEACAPS